MDEVRELSYDMEDCVDDFVARADGGGPDAGGGSAAGIKKIYDWVKKLKPRHEVAGKIKQLKARASEASERHKRYRLLLPTPDSRSTDCAIDPRLPAFYEEVDNLVGIDGPKRHIIQWFHREASSTLLKVLSIAGPGGLGKTTLANQVYRSIKDQFTCSAFVSVSRNPNVKKILRDIAKGVGITDSTSDDDVKQLIDRLRKHLEEERYFIIIDDVWDTRAWETIRLALLNNNLGCRIITTTRNVAIASCSSEGGYVYRMEPLSFADSKRLFFKRVFNSEDLCYPHLARVSKGILEKCAGLPLAIITMSSLLADQLAEEEWKRVLTAIGSALAKDPNAGNMTKILSLSYYDLPQHLRTCLLYLSVFPEDDTISKQRLISRWIAEGLIHEEQQRCKYDVGEGYFNDLINRSLIQPVDVRYGQTEACQVHDIILDFITCKAAEENFVTSFDATVHPHISRYRVRRLCVENHNDEKVTISSSLNLSHVRSLTTFGCFVPNSLLAFPVLRVLDIGECWWLKNHHLANIEKLFLLKYLRIGKSSISEIPRKIGELQYLETLDVRSTNIEELPSTITRLQRLTRLYVDCCTRFPDGVIGQMQSLEDLDEFGVLSYEKGRVNSLQEFSQLTKLRMLKILCSEGGSQADNLRSCLGTLISSCNLYHLYILNAHHIPAHRRLSLPLESWCPTTPCSLRKLHITYCFISKVPNWMRSLGNLRDLELYIFSMTHEDVAILGAIPTLLFLKL